MTITLYEHASADEARRASPFCWRIRLALLHKGLAFETVAWRFHEKERLAFSGQGKVPVLVDDGRVIADSWAIAVHLEQRYPQHSSIFGGPEGMALARFFTNWIDRNAIVLLPMLAADIHGLLAEDDKAYFRETREKILGQTLEAAAADREAALPAFRKSLAAMRTTLRQQPFVSGDRPAWSDYAAFSLFQWARCTSPLQLLERDDPIFSWRERMLDCFGGVARAAVGYAV